MSKLTDSHMHNTGCSTFFSILGNSSISNIMRFYFSYRRLNIFHYLSLNRSRRLFTFSLVKSRIWRPQGHIPFLQSLQDFGGPPRSPLCIRDSPGPAWHTSQDLINWVQSWVQGTPQLSCHMSKLGTSVPTLVWDEGAPRGTN